MIRAVWTDSSLAIANLGTKLYVSRKETPPGLQGARKASMHRSLVFDVKIVVEKLVDVHDAHGTDGHKAVGELVAAHVVAAREGLDDHGEVHAGDVAELVVSHSGAGHVEGTSRLDVGQDEQIAAGEAFLDGGAHLIAERVHRIAQIQSERLHVLLLAADELRGLEDGLRERAMRDEDDIEHASLPERSCT